MDPYLLKPNETRLDIGMTPTEDVIMTYPRPTNLNYAIDRPQTMIYGTAPYMAGKGSPAELIMVSDRLRPQSTTAFQNDNRYNTGDDFPFVNTTCKIPLRFMDHDPVSTVAKTQNNLFNLRYN